jgi:EAL domain-containing protein (putative c-di-GMP-specific phosphodiesterase class I)
MNVYPFERIAGAPKPAPGVLAAAHGLARAAIRGLRSLLPRVNSEAREFKTEADVKAPGQGGVDNWVDSMSNRRACAFVFIANFPHLAEAFSEDFAAAASREVRRRLAVFSRTTARDQMVQLRNDCFLLWSEDETSPHGVLGSPRVSACLEDLLVAIAGEAVRFQGMVALPQLHAGWIEVSNPRCMGAAETELVLWAAQPAPDFQEKLAESWRSRYRADMDVAVRVLEAAHAGRMEIRWQPVVDAYASAATLYREGCVHVFPERGHCVPLTSNVFMPCLERLGLTRGFDRLVAHQIIDALRRSPGANMGLNVSAQSAKLDHWWASTLHAMAHEPEMARRLVVEIGGGGVPVQDAEAARDLCRCLAAYGCRIAIDDFGAGTITLAGLQACKPDIVKLDASFMRRACNSQFGFDSLKDTLALCSHLAQRTVVDGIERAEDLKIALRAGAQWMQGYHLGGPHVPTRVAARPPNVPGLRPNAGAQMRRMAWQPVALAAACSAFLVVATGACMLDVPFSLPVLGASGAGMGMWLQRSLGQE